MRKLALAFGFIWTLPYTLVALALAGLGGAKFVDLEDGVFSFTLPAKSLLHRLFERYDRAAITLGCVVAYYDEWYLNYPSIRIHEETHVRQYMVLGVFFLPAYFVSSLIAKAKGLDAYEGNAFEAHASKAEKACRILNIWE